jgi:hypothetical protein
MPLKKSNETLKTFWKKNEWYYERRKNYYRNFGRSVNRIITPMLIAGGYVSIALKDPEIAGRLRSRFMRNPKSYRLVFSEKAPIEVWPVIAWIIKLVEDEIHLSQSFRGERVVSGWRGLVGLLFAAKAMGTFNYGVKELAALHVDERARLEIKLALEFVGKYRGGAIRPTSRKVIQIVSEFARAFGLEGVECVGRSGVALKESKKRKPGMFKNVPSENVEFIERVNEVLPEQPWPKEIHLEVAEKLGCTSSRVSRAIKHLMNSGRRYMQVEGELFTLAGEKVEIS